MRHREHESGVTLVELLIVLVLTGVIGGIVVSGIVTAFRSSVESQTRIEARQELELTAQQVSRVLRSAERIIIFGDDPDSTIGAQLTSATLTGNVFFGVEDGNGERQLLECRGADASCLEDPAARQLIAVIANDLDADDESVFVYLDRRGEPIPSDGSDPDKDPAGASMITVRLMRELSGDRNPVIVETSVAVRSTRYFGSS